MILTPQPKSPKFCPFLTSNFGCFPRLTQPHFHLSQQTGGFHQANSLDSSTFSTQIISLSRPHRAFSRIQNRLQFLNLPEAYCLSKLTQIIIFISELHYCDQDFLLRAHTLNKLATLGSTSCCCFSFDLEIVCVRRMRRYLHENQTHFRMQYFGQISQICCQSECLELAEQKSLLSALNRPQIRPDCLYPSCAACLWCRKR